MGMTFWIECLVTLVVVFIATDWFLTSVVFSFKRDLNPIALKEQASISTVRKEKETAHYRNYLVPHGFPLTTGLNLAIGYRHRNGNFADIWSTAMELAKNNSIKFTNYDREYSLPQINGMANQILNMHLANNYKQIGITVSTSTLEGFTISIAAMIGSIKNDLIPHFLSSVPRQKIENVDVLVVNSWNSLKLLNGSESWYKLIIVCESSAERPANLNIDFDVKSWDELIDSYVEQPEFKYTSPEDKSDDMKPFLQVTSPWNDTTSFTQMSIVSSVAAFVRSFPMDKEIQPKDTLMVVGSLADASSSVQIWNKMLGTLLFGASLSFTTKYSVTMDQPTMLVISKEDTLEILKKTIKYADNSFFSRIKLSWSTTLLSEGILTNFAMLNTSESSATLKNLRVVYVVSSIVNAEVASSLTGKIQKRKSMSSTSITTRDMNILRAQLGCRAVSELYCPFLVMGPLSETHYFDYRVLPPSVDTTVSMNGTLATTLEGKLVDTEENPDLDVKSRQGMICIRGFSIGRPVEQERLDKALKLCENYGGGEGWMPLIGVYGLWGNDGCLYVYK
ncbi:hypothetical protein Kpol_1051p12 [Vanderwaltozyma polyspora DSM 70294]|uniref:AMP-dependent synthetase/ligase domain-containing protein n=1 Tax=Vanderwaltozyma polyspora (strain ATCC 22028 / DSM 70294 / BCRC 21397 / CBS 2163 / NBRC 10782 / NRRL Y-8283 / UCD 57-17) TaxID=436907 RepID=A7TMX6_VANPO|nr:uncharacterized protein Kpol_1051p12 [Vanderwaltozyma polyspora DSM 70294]EDO16364.1 hypothetical protein Kpol_1051p12 [Vanderwaltozyma polyspora DSM 70294]